MIEVISKPGLRARGILNALKAVSDITRIRILNILSFGAFNVNELVTVLGMGQSRISRHLKILTDAGLLSSQREGTWVYYKLADEVSTDSLFAPELAKFIISHKEDLPERERDQKKVSQLIKEREEKSNRFFNKIGNNWESVQEQVLSPTIYRKALLNLLPPKLETIVDLGCGPGTLIPDLLLKAKKIIGVDSSSKMIETASKSFASEKRANFIQANLENLPLENNSIEVVTASMVMHHISNPPLVFHEAYRFLKDDGILCIVDLKKHDKEFMRDNYADLWLGFESSLLEEWLRNSGFEVESSTEIETETEFKIIIIKAMKKGGLNVRSNNKQN